MTRLGLLLPDIPSPLGCVEVAALASDSRRVAPGSCFFAVPGNAADGLGFVPDALARGAVAVVAEHPPEAIPAGVAVVVVPDVRLALARAAAAFFAAQPKTTVAVTGTSGKTSVAAFVRQIWEHQGLPAASLGTVGLVAPGMTSYGSLTTPDPLRLHKTLAELAQAGIDHLALEASSHGIEQRRLDGVRLQAAAFTNLSRDHLDYHGTVEAYLAAKLRLFRTLLPQGAPAVVEMDGEHAEEVVAACAGRPVFGVGRRGTRLRLLDARPDGVATALTLDLDGRTCEARLPLAGAFQVSNALVAAGLCLVTGSPADAVIAALGSLQGAPGRLQLVGEKRMRDGSAAVFVDYAHKPDALDKVLGALRPLTRAKLVAVFGCGGDRDRGKRAIMGAIAARLADRVVVTDDNPRSEEPALIRAAILEGTGEGPAEVSEVADRAAAIHGAVEALGPGDVLVIAGKGHETGQIVGAAVLPFSDVSCAEEALARLALARQPSA